MSQIVSRKIFEIATVRKIHWSMIYNIQKLLRTEIIYVNCVYMLQQKQYNWTSEDIHLNPFPLSLGKDKKTEQSRLARITTPKPNDFSEFYLKTSLFISYFTFAFCFFIFLCLSVGPLLRPTDRLRQGARNIQLTNWGTPGMSADFEAGLPTIFRSPAAKSEPIGDPRGSKRSWEVRLPLGAENSPCSRRADRKNRHGNHWVTLRPMSVEKASGVSGMLGMAQRIQNTQSSLAT